MPRKDFFTEIRTHYISPECKERRHSDCDGWVPRKDFNGHDKACSCHWRVAHPKVFGLRMQQEMGCPVLTLLGREALNRASLNSG